MRAAGGWESNLLRYHEDCGWVGKQTAQGVLDLRSWAWPVKGCTLIQTGLQDVGEGTLIQKGYVEERLGPENVGNQGHGPYFDTKGLQGSTGHAPD